VQSVAPSATGKNSITKSIIIVITGGRSSTSVNGDIAIQREWSNFDPSQNQNPLTDYDKTLQNWLHPRDERVTQNLCQSAVRVRLGKYVKYNTKIIASAQCTYKWRDGQAELAYLNSSIAGHRQSGSPIPVCWRRGSVVWTSVFPRSKPDLRLTSVTCDHFWLKSPLWVNQLCQLSLPSLLGR